MNNYIYYNPIEQGLLIKSNFEELQKRMEIGLSPKINYQKIDFSRINSIDIRYVVFDNIIGKDFLQFQELFARKYLESVAFHETIANLSGIKIKAKHLVVGEKSKIDLSSEFFQDVKEITFLSVKTFKGKMKDKFDSVEKVILWYENNKANEIISHFPNLRYFQINNGSLDQLDLSNNTMLESLQLHLCTKLEKVKIAKGHELKEVLVERCKKLDLSNLGNNVTIWNT